MPRRKEPVVEEDVPIDVVGLLSHKKHKKHKHKKHKKRKDAESDPDEGSGEGSPTPGDGRKPGLKLKIKIGGQPFGEARVSKSETGGENELGDVEQHAGDAASSSVNPPKKSRKVDDEDAWLEALEAGRLEEVDEELRRMKDPTLMTARQRSLLESKAHKDKEENTPVVYEEKEMTEEMIQRKMIRAKKRKEQAEEKREKDKKQTIERLLKKTDAKVKGTKKFAKKTDAPKVTYVDSEVRGLSLSLPSGYDYPLQAKSANPPPTPLLCGVKGCKNVKRYSCSKTGVPLCSLECYKKNLSAFSRTAVHVA